MRTGVDKPHSRVDNGFDGRSTRVERMDPMTFEDLLAQDSDARACAADRE